MADDITINISDESHPVNVNVSCNEDSYVITPVDNITTIVQNLTSAPENINVVVVQALNSL